MKKGWNFTFSRHFVWVQLSWLSRRLECIDKQCWGPSFCMHTIAGIPSPVGKTDKSDDRLPRLDSAKARAHERFVYKQFQEDLYLKCHCWRFQRVLLCSLLGSTVRGKQVPRCPPVVMDQLPPSIKTDPCIIHNPWAAWDPQIFTKCYNPRSGTSLPMSTRPSFALYSSAKTTPGDSRPNCTQSSDKFVPIFKTWENDQNISKNSDQCGTVILLINFGIDGLRWFFASSSSLYMARAFYIKKQLYCMFIDCTLPYKTLSKQCLHQT